ncbi:MAG: D-alanyl-D-alanine carboxypeptidase [Tyzzerella sp.]|nr:D-alanyl-D-alanine carboxypeptidase [Tyzzerella sp.]
MKRFLAFFVSFILICGFDVQAGGNNESTDIYAQVAKIEEPASLYAHAAVLMDADSGRVLFNKNGDEVLANASTTKILTCILALELGNLDDIVTASESAAVQPRVHLGMKAGEKFVLRDLLYSLMLESHNDSAVAIAEHVAGTTEKFADTMNEKAKKIGCKNTYFITPNGLDAVDEKGSHSTTASDLAKIMSYCIMESEQKDMFITITGTPNYSFSNADGTRNFSCSNHNSFLTMMEGAFSGKTGFTGKAGYCYVGALEQDGRTFVVALLACGWPNNKNYKWSDTRKLMEYGLENYAYRSVEEQIELPRVEVMDGVAEDGELFKKAYAELEVDYGSDIDFSYLLRKDEKIEVSIECEETLEAPLKRGDRIGTVIYSLNGNKIQQFPIVMVKNVEERRVSWIFEKIAEMYFCF